MILKEILCHTTNLILHCTLSISTSFLSAIDLLFSCKYFNLKISGSVLVCEVWNLRVELQGSVLILQIRFNIKDQFSTYLLQLHHFLKICDVSLLNYFCKSMCNRSWNMMSFHYQESNRTVLKNWVWFHIDMIRMITKYEWRYHFFKFTAQ